MADRRVNFGRYETLIGKATTWEEARPLLIDFIRNVQEQVDELLKNTLQREDLADPLIVAAPKQAPKDTDVLRSQSVLHVDEENNKLKFKVRLSSGVLKNAEVNFT
jgi:hypothetical protein